MQHFYTGIPLSGTQDGEVFAVYSDVTERTQTMYAWVDNNLFMLVPTQNVNGIPCDKCREAAQVKVGG